MIFWGFKKSLFLCGLLRCTCFARAPRNDEMARDCHESLRKYRNDKESTPHLSPLRKGGGIYGIATSNVGDIFKI